MVMFLRLYLNMLLKSRGEAMNSAKCRHLWWRIVEFK